MPRPRRPWPLALCLALLAAACTDEPEPGTAVAAEVSAPAERAAPPAQEKAAERPQPREPRFATRRLLAVGGKPESVLAADLDGDGRAELATVTAAPGRLLVWSGTERGLAGTPRAIDVGGWSLEPVALPPGSFGAPAGHRPLAVASRERGELAVVDACAGGAARELMRATLPGVPRAIGAGEVGADGSPEVAVATDGRHLALVGEDGAVRDAALGGDWPRCALVLAGGEGVVVGFQDTSSLELCAAPDGREWSAALDGFPRALAEVDLDGDGDLELVAVGGERSAWAFGLGAPGGASAWIDAPDAAPARWTVDAIPLALERFDRAGLGGGQSGPALAVLHHYDLTWALYAAGGGVPERPFLRGYAGQTPAGIALADLDGDGALDLAVANRDSQAIGLLSGDGEGGFFAAHSVPVGVSPASLAVGDLTGDGATDALVLETKDESLSLLANEHGQLARVKAMPVGPAPAAVACADLDGDGRLDAALLVTDAAGSRLVVLLGGEDGPLARRAPDVPLGARASDLLLADVDGDGRTDAVVTEPDAGAVAWIANETRAPGQLALAPPRHLTVPSAPVALAAIELDGRAPVEIAVALGAPGPQLGVALLGAVVAPDGAWVLTERERLPAGGVPIAVAAGDLDGDGREDLAVLSRADAHTVAGFVQAFLRSGGAADASFEALEPLPTGQRPHRVRAADLDGDGRADLLVPCQNSHVVNVWLARREGEQLAFRRLDDLGAHLGCLDVAVADVDGDGRLDLLVANAFSDDVSVIANLER